MFGIEVSLRASGRIVVPKTREALQVCRERDDAERHYLTPVCTASQFFRPGLNPVSWQRGVLAYNSATQDNLYPVVLFN